MLLSQVSTWGNAAVIQAASCSQNHVQAAIGQAREGDTVLVPAGNATWSAPLIITKGIILKGAGKDHTVITGIMNAPAGGIITYQPQFPGNNEPFRISGFTLDGSNTCNCIYIANLTNIPINRVRIDHNQIMNAGGTNAGRCVAISGMVHGVIDSNEFAGAGKKIDVKGLGQNDWSQTTFAFGSAQTIFFEDNLFLVSDTPHSAGDGGRYCARFNTYRTSLSLWPWFDAHGNMGPGGNYSTMGVEIYGNGIEAGTRDAQIDIRGGKAMVFDNRLTVTSGYGFIRVREEFADSLNPPAVSPSGQPQHVSDSYFWNNTRNGTDLFSALLGSENVGLALQENREFFNHHLSFTGTSGMGVGPLANRPSSCTPGVAYWAVDAGEDWNRINGTVPDGILYKCTAPNVWTAYYTPYTYPHPLRISGPLADEETSQTLSLVPGWNWISFNVLPTDRSLNNVFGGILNQMEQVRTQTESALHMNGSWVGDLQNMDGMQTGKMYKVRVNAACTLVVTGQADLSANPILLDGGWNWVAYLPVNPMATGTALQSIASQVQQVRSQTQSAIYQNGQWIGDLVQMNPGLGYTIRMGGSGTLVFQTE